MRLFPFHPNPIQPEEHLIEKKIFKHSLVFPTVFLTLLWLIKIFETALSTSFSQWGIYPLKINTLKGILFSPLLHGDWNHLIANSISLFVLMVGLFYFYRHLSYRIFFFIYFSSGILLWLAARPSFHIGASGIVYGLASFLFLSGLIRKDGRLLSIAMIVVFLYGGLFWGIFPIKPGISWEGHLWGAVSGIIIALYYRHLGPKQHLYDWELEEEENDNENDNIEINENQTSKNPIDNQNHTENRINDTNGLDENSTK